MYIMILDDGTTYGQLDGCKVAWLPEGVDDAEAWIRDNSQKLVPVIAQEHIKHAGALE